MINLKDQVYHQVYQRFCGQQKVQDHVWFQIQHETRDQIQDQTRDQIHKKVWSMLRMDNI